jgi:crotonobetainyl-CoA:carnitine CoA-transferase CaiB-like acyl-CoA transferase
MQSPTRAAPNGHNRQLAGVVMVDLARGLAWPHAATMLADLGSRVIEVENPDGGDNTELDRIDETEVPAI